MIGQDNKVIQQNTQINGKLTPKNNAQEQLNNYLWFKFQDDRKAGQAGGISYERIRQIKIGYCLPKSAKLIRQLARGWDIDEIKLTQIFKKIEEKINSCPDFQTADKIQENKDAE